MSKRRVVDTLPHSAASFPTTQWGVVLAAGNPPGAGGDQALEDLCRTYWSPLYAYLRRKGEPPHDAQDLTQGFLARVIAREDLANVGPEKGRFRTYLLAGLRNYAVKRALHDKALKRGGDHQAITINGDHGEQICGPDLLAESPEQAFDRRWCRTVLTVSIRKLREEHQARRKEALFDALAPFLDGAEPGDYDQVAARLGMSTGTLAVTIHRLRARLQEVVRMEIARTVSSSEQIEDEIRYLMAVWQR